MNGDTKEHDLIINIPPERVRQQYVLLWQLAGHSQTCRQSGFLLQVFGRCSYKHSGQSKVDINSDKYKNLFGWVEIRKDVNNKHNLKTTKNGEFYASSVNGTITSKHFDILGSMTL